jgi:hypothetical protein
MNTGAASDLFGIVIGDGIAIFHPPLTINCTSDIEHRFKQRGLTRAAMRDKRNIADSIRCVPLHD